MCGDLDWSTAFNLEAAVVASETGCRGLELRSGGEFFGAGDRVAASRALFEPGVGVAVLRADGVLAVGVFDRVTGVLAREVGVPCCRDVLPLAATRLDPAGELDRVEAGLAESEVEFSFLTEMGNRDEDDACGEGD